MAIVTQRHRDWLEGREDEIWDERDFPEMLNGLFRDRNAWTNGFYNTPIALQVRTLGLSRKEINSIGGKRVLDIGCGSNPALVYWLRELGAEAEGVDHLVAKEEPFLMKRAVGASGSEDGRIPRADGHYDLVLANLVSPLQYGLSNMRSLSQGTWGEPTAEHIVKATMIVLEGLRVLGPEGRFVCWPGFSRNEYLNPILAMSGYEMLNVPLFDDMGSGESQIVGDAVFRTEIQRARAS